MGLVQPTRSSKGRAAPRPQADFAPAWPCSRWGLPGRRHCCRRRWSLTPPFHPYLKDRRPISQAVVFCGPFRGSPRPGVTRHHALWSADFPQTTFAVRDHLANPIVVSIIPSHIAAVNRQLHLGCIPQKLAHRKTGGGVGVCVAACPPHKPPLSHHR